MKKTVFAILALFAITGIFAQERIAVLPFGVLDNIFTQSEADFFYRMFCNEFANKTAGKYHIIPRQQVELRSLSVNEKIVYGEIKKIGSSIIVSTIIYVYPEFMRLSGIDSLMVTKDELFDNIPELAQSVISAIGGINMARVYLERGLFYKNHNEWDAAIHEFNEAIRLDPAYTLAFQCRGELYRDKKDYDLAIADFTRVIRLDPDYKWAYFNRGNIYSDKGDYDLAIADFTWAIRLSPDYSSAYYNRGLAYSSKKDYDLAIADYETVLIINPYSLAAKIKLDEALEALEAQNSR